MAIELCPHCQTRVFLGADRICPSCQAFVAEPDPAMVAAAKAESEGERASTPGAGNPYQSPAYASEKKDVPNSVQGMEGLAWILLSFEGRIPRRVFWCAMLGNTAVFYACSSYWWLSWGMSRVRTSVFCTWRFTHPCCGFLWRSRSKGGIIAICQAGGY